MLNLVKPKVTLLHHTPLGVAEFAARICYDSFDKSENLSIRERNVQSLDIASSAILEDLTWVRFHHSVLEHLNFSFLIEDISRGVLQELARHRIHSLSVRSTRYTLSDILYAFVEYMAFEDREQFILRLQELKPFVVDDPAYERMLACDVLHKLMYHLKQDGKELTLERMLSRENRENFENKVPNLYGVLQKGKKKRNAGDHYKDIVDDNFKTSLVSTWNARSLKNFFTLRDSSAAYPPMRELAKAMKAAIPETYTFLFDKRQQNEMV